MQTLPVCPRCHGFIPTNAHPGRHPGATSRVAPVEVCSDCGGEEAVTLLAPPSEWPVQFHYDDDRVRGAHQRYVEAIDLLDDPNGIKEALTTSRYATTYGVRKHRDTETQTTRSC